MATVDRTTERSDGVFDVSVTVHNEGEHAAADVEVVAELTIGDQPPTTGTQTLVVLGPGQDETLHFLFDDDPGAGELSVAVTSFAEP